MCGTTDAKRILDLSGCNALAKRALNAAFQEALQNSPCNRRRTAGREDAGAEAPASDDTTGADPDAAASPPRAGQICGLDGCTGVMRRRTASTPANLGRPFIGCSNYASTLPKARFLDSSAQNRNPHRRIRGLEYSQQDRVTTLMRL